MSTTLTINGTGYSFPAVGEREWGQKVINWATAATNGLLQKSGGAFTLTAEIDFGGSFGLKTLYYKSRGSNVASAGVVRLSNNEIIAWRNAANSADKNLKVNGSDQLEFDGSNLQPLTTNEDILVRRSGNNTRLAVGAEGQVLQIVSGAVAWGALVGASVKARGTYCVGAGTTAAGLTIPVSDRILGNDGASVSATGDGYYNSFIPSRAGSILGYGISAFITGWVASEEWHGVFHIKKNGTRIISSSAYDHTSGTNVTQFFTATFATGTHTFVAGDKIQVEIECTSTVGTVTHVIQCQVDLEYNT